MRETAAIATAAWIDGGLISKSNTRLVIDHNKVKRAQEKLMKSLSLEFDEECRTEKISCILFDGRKDLTKTLMTIDGSARKYPATIKEEHYTVCAEPGGKYLCHFTPKEATKNMKHAEIIADNIVKFLRDRGIDQRFKSNWW